MSNYSQQNFVWGVSEGRPLTSGVPFVPPYNRPCVTVTVNVYQSVPKSMFCFNDI